MPVSVARARRIRRRNIRNDKEAIEQKAIHENVTFGKISAETLARHAVLEASLAEVQAEIDAETASTPKIDVARGDDAGASLEITPGGEIIVDGRSAGRIPSRSDPFLTGDPIVDGVRWPGPDTVLLPEDREKLSEAHAREIARQDASRCGVCGKPVSLLADCIGERVDGTFTVYHRVCREPKQGTLEGGAGAVRTTEQFAEAADYHPTHAPGEQGGRPDVKDAIAVPDQTGRRDVHGGVPLSEHTACPDLAHCDCECSVCKRAWEDAGRPKPDAGEPDDGAPGTDGYNSFGNGE